MFTDSQTNHVLFHSCAVRCRNSEYVTFFLLFSVLRHGNFAGQVESLLVVVLCSGYIGNKTETKQFCFSFISYAVTCEIKQKQNTETILKRFRIILELS